VSVKSRKTRTLTDDQRARKNKRRRELYHEKNQSKKQTKTGAERNRDYKRRLKDFWENNLHPESIAMENPQFIPQIICKLVSTHEHIKISHTHTQNRTSRRTGVGRSEAGWLGRVLYPGYNIVLLYINII